MRTKPAAKSSKGSSQRVNSGQRGIVLKPPAYGIDFVDRAAAGGGPLQLSPPVIQAKLTVNAPGDEYEQEADRVAEEVMATPAVQRAELEGEDEKPEVMTKPQPSPAAGGAFAVRKAFERPLPSALREEFETKPEVMTKPQPRRRRAGRLRCAKPLSGN